MNIGRRFMILSAGCTMLTLLACSSHGNHGSIPNGPAAYDERFLKWLVNHHNNDDRMIDPCAKNETIRKELRDFCTNVDQQHRERIERMRTWLKDWYGEDLPRTDNIPLWLGGLKGQQFEREFFKEYEHDHAEAAQAIKECSSNATHAELRELCQRIAPGQQKQLKQLRQWRCEWFKDCG